MPQLLQVSVFSLILNMENLFSHPEIHAIGHPNLWYWYIWLIFPLGLIPISNSMISPIGQTHRQKTFPKTTPKRAPPRITSSKEM
jgi:hypothetical protein